MAFIKLKKPQNIIDNLDKIKKGDLIFLRLPKKLNSITNKHFLFGMALADVQTRLWKPIKSISPTAKYWHIHMLFGDKFMTITYIKKLSNPKGKKGVLNKTPYFLAIQNYKNFMEFNIFPNIKGI